MAHQRKRYLEKQILKDLTWAKTISLLGMRQVGKTTLVRSIAKSYFTYDESKCRNQALSGDWSFLEGVKQPTAIDETQMVPDTFSQIKFIVDKNNKPGQFILTGSVRFLSKKNISESLTGRTSILELLPLNVAESHEKVLSEFISTIIGTKNNDDLIKKLKTKARFNSSDINQHSVNGGLPGICFKRDRALRNRSFDLHLETILSRDINLIAPTKLSYLKMRQLLVELLRTSGLPINKSLFAKIINTSGPTVNKLLDAFEALFLVKKHGSTYYPIDLGLDYFLSTQDSTRMNKIIFSELRSQLEYGYRSSYEFLEVRSRGGLFIPFLIKIKEGKDIAIVYDADEKTSDKSLKSLTWFKKKAKNTITLACHAGDNAYISSAGHICIPYQWIF